jgi:hypothetical protein
LSQFHGYDDVSVQSQQTKRSLFRLLSSCRSVLSVSRGKVKVKVKRPNINQLKMRSNTAAGHHLSRFLPGRREQNGESRASLASLLFARLSTVDHFRSTEGVGLRSVSVRGSTLADAARRTRSVPPLQADGSRWQRIHMPRRVSGVVRVASTSIRTSVPRARKPVLPDSSTVQMLRFGVDSSCDPTQFGTSGSTRPMDRQTDHSTRPRVRLLHRTRSSEQFADQPVVRPLRLPSPTHHALLDRTARQVHVQSHSTRILPAQMECVRYLGHCFGDLLRVRCAERFVRSSIRFRARTSSRSLSDPLSRYQKVQRHGRSHAQHSAKRTVARRLLRLLRPLHLYRPWSRTVRSSDVHCSAADSAVAAEPTVAQLFRGLSHWVR